jgi:predicted ester cyclase
MPDAATIQRQMFEAVQRGDSHALRELAHPDYTYQGVDGGTYGIDASIAVAEQFITAFPDLTIEFVRVWSPDPETAIAEVRMSGTHDGPLGDVPPTGRRVQGVGCNIVEVRDGTMWRERDYFDNLSALEQIGAIPATRAAGA